MTDDLDIRLSNARPRELTDESTQELLDRIRQRVDMERRAIAPARIHRVRPWVQRSLGAVAAAAAVIGGVTLADQGPADRGPSGGAPGVDVAAPADQPALGPELQEVALLAPASTVPMQPGQFLYMRDVLDGDKATITWEIWRPQHTQDPWTKRTTVLDPGTGALLAPPETVTARCGSFDEEPAEQGGCEDAGSFEDPTPQFLTTLPTEPAALYQQLRSWALSSTSEAPGRQGAAAQDQLQDPGYQAEVVMQAIRRFADATNGMSQPFSQTLQQALAGMPGAVTGGATNLAGKGVVSYAAAYVDTMGDPAQTIELVFDADGNYVGTPGTEVLVGVADQAGVTPVLD